MSIKSRTRKIKAGKFKKGHHTSQEETRYYLNKLANKQKLNRIERLRLHGYSCIHLFKDWWLVRKYSIYSARFSLYTISKIKENS